MLFFGAECRCSEYEVGKLYQKKKKKEFKERVKLP